MEGLLQTAWAQESAIRLVQGIVDTCRACRTWARPRPSPMATARLAEFCNELVQRDLLFRVDGETPAHHLIDACAR
eukprot:9158234-Pyramimonas_sp.AAC.1